MRTLFDAAGGMDGIRRLAHAWHERVLADPVVSHAFSHGFHPDHTERLAAYWAEALGGPRAYSTAYGDEAQVVRMHSGNGEHDDMDDRAIACFDQALGDAGLAADRALGDAGLAADRALFQALHDYFAWATRGAMARYPGSKRDVPASLGAIPRWTWNGPDAPGEPG